jgi:hypothetical protein
VVGDSPINPCMEFIAYFLQIIPLLAPAFVQSLSIVARCGFKMDSRAPSAPPGFRTRGTWTAGALYVVVPSGPLIAITEAEISEGEGSPLWYCITKGRWVASLSTTTWPSPPCRGSPPLP